MNRLRDALKKNRTFVLAFLLVETFYWADGLQFVYAHTSTTSRTAARRRVRATTGSAWIRR